MVFWSTNPWFSTSKIASLRLSPFSAHLYPDIRFVRRIHARGDHVKRSRSTLVPRGKFRVRFKNLPAEGTTSGRLPPVRIEPREVRAGISPKIVGTQEYDEA